MDNRTFLTTCPVCSGTCLDSYFKCKDNLVTGELFEIVGCSVCGLSFTQGYPTDNAIGAYYENEAYVSHSDTSEGLFFRLYHGVRKIMLERKCSYVASLVSKKIRKPALLDYGCGTGYFLNAMRRRSWDVLGLEVNPEARVYGRDKFSIEIEQPDLLATLPDDEMDVVTLWHVLEHVSDLRTLLSEIRRVLKPEGRLVIAVPNPSSYDARHYKEHWAAYDVPRHLWHFSPFSLVKLMKSCGFEIEKRTRMPFDGFYISMMSEQQKRAAFPYLKGMMVGFFGWIASWFSVEGSSSVIYTFKQNDKT